MEKMWAGRFQKALDQQADDFNSSIHFDKRMYRQDITGSMAHAAMLGAQGIITENGYVRMHGNANCSAGGAFCDVFNTIKKYGIVPEVEYKGLNYGTEQHKHAELDALVKAYVGVIVKAPMKTDPIIPSP